MSERIKVQKLIYFFLLIAVFCSNAVEFFGLKSTVSDSLVLTSYMNIGVLVVVFILERLKIIRFQVASALIIYSVILNIHASFILLTNHSLYNEYFSRSVIVIGTLAVAGGLGVNRIHTIIVGLIFFFYLFLMIVLKNNLFLIRSVVVLVFSLGGLLGWIYFILYLYEKSYTKILDNNKEIKEINEHLQIKKEELQKSNTTKDTLFSIISHDMKNSFSFLVGMSELIHLQVKSGNLNDIRNQTEQLNNMSRDLYFLLNNLLSWSKIHRGSFEFKPDVIHVYSLFEEFCLSFQPALTAKNLTLDTDCSPDLSIWADINMVRIIIRNLVSNAIKYSFEGKSITLAASKKEDKVILSVKDAGTGISKEDIEQLFHSNVITSVPGTKDEHGTGLGLMLSKEFIDIHQEKIWVESQVSKGTTFYFSFPSR